MKKMVDGTKAILGIFGIMKPKSKADYVREYLRAAGRAESLCEYTAQMFAGMEDYKDVIFRDGIWRFDILPSAQRKALMKDGKIVDELTERLYRLEKAIRQRTRRERKKTEGKHNDGGPRKRLTPRLCALSVLSLAKTGQDGDLYIAGLLDGIAFEAHKEDGEKTFFPAWQRLIADAETASGVSIMPVEEFKKEYERISEKAEKEGITRDEAEILEAFEAVS